jgi:hypothetical protein
MNDSEQIMNEIYSEPRGTKREIIEGIITLAGIAATVLFIL